MDDGTAPRRRPEDDPDTAVVAPAASLRPDPDDEPAMTRRERLAAVVEDRLDPAMAVLGLLWVGFVLYEQVAPADQRDELALISNVIWGVFVVEFLVKLWVSGHPVRFLIRRWPSVLFLALPALRVLRVVRAVRAFRLLPAARVISSGYRAIGNAGQLLRGRIAFLGATTVIAILSGGQLLYVFEARQGGAEGLGDALWWAANLAISSTPYFEPETIVGRIVTLVLSAYAIVVFAALAATLGAFFVDTRQEQEAVERGDV